MREFDSVGSKCLEYCTGIYLLNFSTLHFSGLAVTKSNKHKLAGARQPCLLDLRNLFSLHKLVTLQSDILASV